MNLDKRLKKIDADIAKGLKFKSADRLRNLINQYPDESFLWDKLARLYYESGFLDAAGRYWILTKPTEPHIKKCVDLYEKSVNYSGTQILHDITYRGDKANLDSYAWSKLAELEKDSIAKSNYIPSFKKVNQSKEKEEIAKKTTSFKDRLEGTLVIALLIAIPIFAIIGFVSVLRWIF